MKRISVTVTETVTYEQKFEVPDDFDVEDSEALDELWCQEGDPDSSFMSVDERECSGKEL